MGHDDIGSLFWYKFIFSSEEEYIEIMVDH